MLKTKELHGAPLVVEWWELGSIKPVNRVRNPLWLLIFLSIFLKNTVSFVLYTQCLRYNICSTWFDAILELGVLSRSDGKHQLKTQGTSKICNICSAQMEVIQLEYGYRRSNCNLHLYSLESSKQLAHLPILTSVKLKIASKLQQGVTIQSVLDWIRDGEGDKLGRQHLMSSQEVATQHSQETSLQKLKCGIHIKLSLESYQN